MEKKIDVYIKRKRRKRQNAISPFEPQIPKCSVADVTPAHLHPHICFSPFPGSILNPHPLAQRRPFSNNKQKSGIPVSPRFLYCNFPARGGEISRAFLRKISRVFPPVLIAGT